MIKLIIIAQALLFIAFCGDSYKRKTEIPLNQDSVVLNTSLAVLNALSSKDYDSFCASFSHKGVRFSPYAYVDSGAIVLSASQFLSLIQSDSLLLWGYYDGSGDSMELSLSDYLFKFLYNHDYLNAEIHSINSFKASGNSLNNLEEFYPNMMFTEHYFSGFNPQYGGLDWACIRLVYEKQ